MLKHPLPESLFHVGEQIVSVVLPDCFIEDLNFNWAGITGLFDRAPQAAQLDHGVAHHGLPGQDAGKRHGQAKCRMYWMPVSDITYIQCTYPYDRLHAGDMRSGNGRPSRYGKKRFIEAAFR